jgi:hypothetical protein
MALLAFLVFAFAAAATQVLFVLSAVNRGLSE